MSELPKDVVSVKQTLLRDPPDKLSDIAKKLMEGTPELASMWETLEKHEDGSDDLWVWAFLQAASNSKDLPAFHFKKDKDRKELSEEITSLAKRLATKLEVNGLDAHLFHNNGKMFNGFFLYEDFGETNRESIDNDGIEKLKISELLISFATRTREIIKNEPMSGKIGKNADAIRFARLISKRNIFLYDKSLNNVVAAATNALFGTNYRGGDISNLLNR